MAPTTIIRSLVPTNNFFVKDFIENMVQIARKMRAIF
jgi:hypothetical protein